MARPNFIRKMIYMIFCTATVFILFFCPAPGAAMTGQQMEKLNQAEELLNQLGTDTGTAGEKLGLARQILGLCSELAEEAKTAGNAELAEKTAKMISKTAEALHNVIEKLPDPKDPGLLQTALDAAETASSANLKIAELARDTQNTKLAQDAVSAVMKLKQVFHRLKISTQYVIHSSEDAETVHAAEILFGKIGQVELINQNAFDTAVAAGAKPPKHGPEYAEHPPGWWRHRHHPLDDHRTASGM